VHSGKTMDSGHYYSIIRDLDSGNWFKFDDRDVTPFPVEFLHENHPKVTFFSFVLGL
jgi:ubiquitin C-terminal hydrolase